MATTTTKAVRIEVEARTEGAVRGIDKLAEATKKAQEQAAKLDGRLKASEASWQKVGERIDAARGSTVTFGQASEELGAKQRTTAHSVDAFSAAATKARREASEPLRRSIAGMARDYDGTRKAQGGFATSLAALKQPLVGTALGMKGLVEVNKAWHSAVDEQVEKNHALVVSLLSVEKATETVKKGVVSKAEEDQAAIGVMGRAAAGVVKWAGVVFTLGASYGEAEKAEREFTRSIEEGRLAVARRRIEGEQAAKSTRAAIDLVNSAKQISVQIDLALADIASRRIQQLFQETSATEGLAKATAALAEQRSIDAAMTSALRAKGQLQVEAALDFFGLDGNRIIQEAAAGPQEVKRRGGGQKKDNRAFKRLASMETAGLMMGRGGMRDAGAQDPFSKEAQAAELAAVIDFEAAKSQIQLNQRLRSIEEQKAAGVDPITLIAAEENARVAFLEREMQRAENKIEKDQIRDQIEATHHEARLQRMDAEKAKLEALGLTNEQISERAADLAAGVAQAWLMSGDLSAKGFAKAVAGFAKAEAIRMAIVAVREGVLAIASAASYNFPAAALHAAAAAKAAAGAVAMGALAGGLGAAAGSGGGGGSGTTMFGGGPGFGGPAANEAPSGGSKGQKDTIPISPGEERLQQSITSQGAGGGGGTTIVNVNAQVLGAIDETAATKIAQGIKAAERRAGKLSA